MSQPKRPDLQPMKTNDTATFLVGTALWAIALVVLLIARPAVAEPWWVWTCVAGIGGGLFGLWYSRRYKARNPIGPATDERTGAPTGEPATGHTSANGTAGEARTAEPHAVPPAEHNR
ncbi:hypothetical protein GCM10010106_28950 [Thermopolyspora flexuosa]|nr:DUF2530 domain-containing protein [Thermopolyspora flexuosa]GGM80510.1 hypothetical protein GCM10010106_28950 [Thermopolyspora flexuosa]